MARDRAKPKVDSGADPNAAQAAQDVAVKWYMDVLGFPEPTAKALYTNQTLTDGDVLITLTDKTVDAVCGAICKP